MAKQSQTRKAVDALNAELDEVYAENDQLRAELAKLKPKSSTTAQKK